MTLIETITIILGQPTSTFQENILYMVAALVTAICIMFFLKLFLLIGGYISPKNR